MPETHNEYIRTLKESRLKQATLERRKKRGDEGPKERESSVEAKRIYEEQKDILQRLIERKKGEIEKTEARLQAFKDDTALTADKRGRFVAAVEKILAGHTYALQRFEGQLKFLRPRVEDDIQYRMRVYKELPDAIEQATPPSLSYLRFHGSPIFATETIIRNGTLSSSVDHAGHRIKL